MSTINAIVTDAPKGGVKYTKIDMPEPEKYEAKLKPVYIGICGTDRGEVAGALSFTYNPEGENFLVLGHEALLQVLDVSDNNYIKRGDFVVPLVRRPGKCVNCRIGRQDNCSIGDPDKHEAGITGLHGFMRDVIYDDIQNLVKVNDPDLGKIAVLTEPLKNVMKAFEVFDVVSKRSIFQNDDSTFIGKKMVVIGSGSEAFLYSFVGKDRGFDVTMVNRHDETENKMKMMDDFGVGFSNYLKDMPDKIDLLVDTSGDPSTIFKFVKKVNNNGVVILFGTNGKAPGYPVNGEDIDYIVERNITIAGSVDAAKIHYVQALDSLSNWYHRHPQTIKDIITYEAKPEETNIFFQKPKGEIKTVIKWP
ncbi:glucose 1-dehydrogenase [Thermoplasma volcanium GSS1]|uniref:Glucose 1-dehydrogenase n=1 Tax=Thermoplasma volcanium (strain ATCC 51530 / DSM 4299 / JCM 9571 / NBRC 15438 / GSS1) TaxID=273116 RepID=Q979W2_THEVO|nr:glucose/galactose 1-dehydrogenase [Thermoplasma volcanium]3WIC_A Chain A, Glucose 1-dehydrogenase [Thermoplasma volcanium GSS1]3WIC_B Chain B, Glucose 1-dehydrogenase [Thermoplasma volcanium GSS1]3WIC_C Chain C, Glucose 1-dehydrogenase [Thermoplasma volcanium GSS1]3WIC_D Chain D, Glucose 1-dehydrogenase [Thermoplasma volcanium GSS1]BAB60190.1 glucose 1-dehydrogenase [Thermoplasma volcanium GSS1]